MFRKTSWRKTVSAAVSFHQDQALSTTIFLLKSLGPTGFVLREEGETRNFKVCLGDPHVCTCPVFTREQEPCKHICWVLLRKFRVPRDHEYSFQHGLVERQILEVLHGLHQTEAHRTESDPAAAPCTTSQTAAGREAGSVCRKVIQAQDVCPICQEELLEKKQPVSYCRFGCGNNVHISCMKVWADHQRISDRQETVKCPLCREDFGSLKLLQEQVKNAAKLCTAAERAKADRHLGVGCHSCQVCPVTGKCFKCTVCSYVHLCEDCWKKGRHQQHPLASRTKRREKWRLVEPSDGPAGATAQPECTVSVAADPLPAAALACLPVVRVGTGSGLLDEGQQCRLCLQQFVVGQRVRTLPCHHKFHADCVDGPLMKTNSCPLDGYVIYNPWNRKAPPQLSSCLPSKPAKTDLKDLFVPGVALRDKSAEATPPHGALHPEEPTGSPVTQEITTGRFQRLCVAAPSKKEGKGESHRQEAVAAAESSGDHLSPCDSKASVRRIREEPQLGLFLGLQGPEPEHPAVRRARPQPRRTGVLDVKDPNHTPAPQLRMTGVLINTRHRSQTEN